MEKQGTTCPQVHQIRPEQLDELLNLEDSIFHFPNLSREDLTASLEDSDRNVWVLTVEQRISGFVSVSQQADHPSCWVVRDLGVVKAIRNQGWGRNLLRHAIHQLQRRGAERVLLWVDYDNLPARRLYEEIGFRVNQNEAEVIFAVE